MLLFVLLESRALAGDGDVSSWLAIGVSAISAVVALTSLAYAIYRTTTDPTEHRIRAVETDIVAIKEQLKHIASGSSTTAISDLATRLNAVERRQSHLDGAELVRRVTDIEGTTNRHSVTLAKVGADLRGVADVAHRASSLVDEVHKVLVDPSGG